MQENNSKKQGTELRRFMSCQKGQRTPPLGGQAAVSNFSQTGQFQQSKRTSQRLMRKSSAAERRSPFTNGLDQSAKSRNCIRIRPVEDLELHLKK
jgi:hypothetical protein